MRIGIKYCGGCNPYYDRSKAEARLKAAMSGYVLEPYESDKRWDAVIVICGCTVACAKVKEEENTIYINNEEDIGKAIALVQNLSAGRKI